MPTTIINFNINGDQAIEKKLKERNSEGIIIPYFKQSILLSKGLEIRPIKSTDNGPRWGVFPNRPLFRRIWEDIKKISPPEYKDAIASFVLNAVEQLVSLEHQECLEPEIITFNEHFSPYKHFTKGYRDPIKDWGLKATLNGWKFTK